MKNKKILSLILGTAMIASMPLAGVKAAGEVPVGETISADSYKADPTAGGATFATGLDGQESKSTEILAAIPEYTLDIPADTAIKRGALMVKIGEAKVTGNYFYKPYGVDVSIAKQNFYLVTGFDSTTGGITGEDSAKQIKFTVLDDAKKQREYSNGEWKVPTSDSNATAYPWTDANDVGSNGKSYAYHYYHDGTDTDHYLDNYDSYKVSNINESKDVVLHIPESEWQAAVDNSGVYHAKLTFTAGICTNTTDPQGHNARVHNPNNEILPVETDEP